MRMCAKRRRMTLAMPRERGSMRLNMGPPSTTASTIFSLSTLRAPRSSQLAMALLSTFSSMRAPRLGLKRNSKSPSPAASPRMRSAKGRTFVAAMRAKRCRAAMRAILLLPPGTVPAKRSRGRELAELVPDHLFRHVDAHVFTTVVHKERVADELGRDRRAARPRFDRLLFAHQRQPLDLFEQLRVDKRTFFQRSSHPNTCFFRLSIGRNAVISAGE